VGENERADVLERLDRAGYLDDERFALRRASALAGRGAGDGLIRDDLERRGVPAELVAAAIAALEPEASRAARIVERRGWSAKTARHLAARGFGEDAVAGLVAEEE
jgi:SOS response regulatory protein OraA/RecX